MNLTEFWAEIEANQTWRVDEIRFFQNRLIEIDPVEKQDQYRRVLVLLLYAHFEGFCKFALLHYVRGVNEAKVKCGEVSYAIAATTFADVFQTLRNPQKKCDVFRRSLPDDAKLHRFARDREFLERINELETKPVDITDTVVDTESNLKPVVLKKILYRLGLPHDTFNSLEGQINKLLNYRNDIAHGETKSGIPEKIYEELRDDVYSIMDQVKREVMNALQNKQYLRTHTQE